MALGYVRHAPSARSAFNEAAWTPGFVSNTPDQSLNSQQNQTNENIHDDRSFMQKLFPDRSFKPENEANTQDMKRGTENAATDLNDVKADAQMARSDLEENVSGLTEAWNEAKNEAAGMIEEVAMEKGHDPAEARNTLMSPGDSAADMRTDFAVGAALNTVSAGAGSIVTMGAQGGASIADQIGSTKNLKKEDLDDIAETALKRLQSTAQERFKTASSQAAPGTPDHQIDAGPRWQNIKDLEEFKSFLKADIEDQPEMKFLREKLAELDNEVDPNHALVQAEESNLGTGNKREKAVEFGREDLINAYTGGNTVQTAAIMAGADLSAAQQYSATEIKEWSDTLPQLKGAIKVDPQKQDLVDQKIQAALFPAPDNQQDLHLTPDSPSVTV